MSDLTVVRRPDGNLDVTMGNLQVIVRPQDGWINATELAKSAKKLVAHWTSLKGTEKMIKILEGKVGGPVIETIHGDGGKTWMHEELAKEFASWIQRPRTSRTDEGYVYVVFSPILNGFKVGIWRGSIKGLRSRYTTYYGPTVKLLVWEKVDDCRSVEMEVLDCFNGFSLGGELLDLKAFDKCRQFIVGDWGPPTQIIE